MASINQFLLTNNLRIAQNPCVSPDFCLDWDALLADAKAGKVTEYEKSRFATKAGEWTLLENAAGDCAWKLSACGLAARRRCRAGRRRDRLPRHLGEPAHA